MNIQQLQKSHETRSHDAERMAICDVTVGKSTHADLIPEEYIPPPRAKDFYNSKYNGIKINIKSSSNSKLLNQALLAYLMAQKNN